jgi:hypothetical protein
MNCYPVGVFADSFHSGKAEFFQGLEPPFHRLNGPARDGHEPRPLLGSNDDHYLLVSLKVLLRIERLEDGE